MPIETKHHLKSCLIFTLILTVCACLYYQGLSGPFLFDDLGNIQENAQLRITSLDKESLTSSALSGSAGPLKRPVAMLSFALNYYASGEHQTFTLKLTNVFIQATCAWLLYFFCLQLIRISTIRRTPSINDKKTTFIALSIAMLWAAHPINLTSVLYIVQRMTSLSTLFTLACLVFYIKARNNNANKSLTKNSLNYISSFICFFLAIFSKENALLIPVYLLLIEWVFFSHKTPWRLFDKLSIRDKRYIYGASIFILLSTFLVALDYASGGYSGRSFSLIERVMTEARVICFYLSLIVLPRINAFGLFHDDIPLSTSLTDPWSTLLSIIFISGLVYIAVRSRKSKPLLSFGILFFFSGHLLESTFFALEIAHEHRNHLASSGIIVALAGLFIHHKEFNMKAFILAACAFFSILSATTILRSNEWQNEYDLATFEAAHHPNSAATQGLLSNAAFMRKEYTLAEKAINKSRVLDPTESAYAINSLVLASILGKPINNTLEEDIRAKLKKNPFTTSTQVALAHISTHLNRKGFIPLQPYFIGWLNIILKKLGPTPQASIYHYFLAKAYLATGETLQAINAHQQAFNLDKKFINPLFEMGNIFLALKQADNARVVLKQIEEANANPQLFRHYDKHIDELKIAIEKLKSNSVGRTH